MVAALIILSLCVPVAAIVTGYFTLKSVQMGLRWQIELKQDQKPTMDPVVVPNPFERKPKVELNNDVLDEWLNGEKVSK